MEVEKRRWLKPIETIGDQCSVIPLGNGEGLETKSSWHRTSPPRPFYSNDSCARGVDWLKFLATAASLYLSFSLSLSLSLSLSSTHDTTRETVSSSCCLLVTSCIGLYFYLIRPVFYQSIQSTRSIVEMFVMFEDFVEQISTTKTGLFPIEINIDES